MLKSFFNPKSIAVIGASAHREKIGHTILKNIIQEKYPGNVYPVNPNAEKILSYRCYKKISELPKSIELAIIAIPAQFVIEALKECGEKKIKNIIVISAGFRENGSNGVKLEKDLIEAANAWDLNILGPNSLGMLNGINKINASFANGMINKGKISFISQSGAICSAMLDWAKEENIGFSKFVSLGNMAILNELHFFEYFITDNTTEAVIAYLENFSDGEKFIEIAKKLCSKKPLIILKSGTTEKGRSIALSHTGAMAEDNKIIDGILRQVNAIRCNSLGEIFNIIKLLASVDIAATGGLGVIGNAGGINVITADKVAKSNLTFSKLSEATFERLQAVLPPIAPVNNPLDLIGDARADRYSEAIESFCKDQNILNIIVTLTLQTVTQPLRTADAIVRFKKRYRKNIIPNFIGGSEIKESIKYLRTHKILNFSYPENIIDGLECLDKWRKNLKSKKEELAVRIEDNQKININTALEGKTGILDYMIAKNILETLDLPVIKGMLETDLKKLDFFAQKNGYPVVMKAISPAIIHKTELGGVKIGINSPQEMAKAYEQLIRIGGKTKTNLLPSGSFRHSVKSIASQQKVYEDSLDPAKRYGIKILMQPMIINGLELIVGAKRDNKFGPVVLVGLGGIYTEIFQDTSVRVGEISISEANRMLSELKIHKILEGARGQESSREGVLDLIVKISYLICNFPKIKEIDLNPVIIKDGKLYIADIRIIA